MRTSVIPRSRGLSEAAERQMRIWALDLEAHQRLEQQPKAPKELIYPYVAISRECGVDGGELAKCVCQQAWLESLRSRAARLHG